MRQLPQPIRFGACTEHAPPIRERVVDSGTDEKSRGGDPRDADGYQEGNRELPSNAGSMSRPTG
jgi:hypothetical protein